MKMRSTARSTKRLTLVLAFLGTVFSGSAIADRSEPVRFAAGLDACVSAVTDRLDLSDAVRVRHTVVEKQRSGLGYALSIETSVFSGNAERRYSAYCVANGAGAPLKFRMDERAS